jgi:myo-inositol 2-dehydrogenase / D-chiro-inositol 1-dehydrogenase
MNRRHFLVGSLAAPLASAATQAAPSTIGVGMVGTGNRGSHVMQKVMEAPGTRVAALCDIKPDRLDKAATVAAKHSPKTFRDYRELLNAPGVDAVYICTPCDLHVEQAIAALKAGKHVYCEKPVGITAESIGRLVTEVRASGKVFMVGQQMRSSKRIASVVRKIYDGIAGDVIMVKAQRHAGDDLSHDGSSADWFFNAARSGDVLVEMSVHNLDACNWMIGKYPERAAGFGGTLLWKNDPPGRTNMDGYSLTYDYPNGVKLTYTQIFFHPRGLPNGGMMTHVYGTKGAVDVDNAMYYPRERDAKPVPLWEKEQDQIDIQHVTEFFEAVRAGRQPHTGIEAGASGALTAIMGREAIYQKRVVTWEEMGVAL